MSGYFASTFSWQEITQMRAAQPLTFRDQSYNGKYQCALVGKVVEQLSTLSVPVRRC